MHRSKRVRPAKAFGLFGLGGDMKSLFSSLQRDWASWSPGERVAAVGILTLAPIAAALALFLAR